MLLFFSNMVRGPTFLGISSKRAKSNAIYRYETVVENVVHTDAPKQKVLKGGNAIVGIDGKETGMTIDEASNIR